MVYWKYYIYKKQVSEDGGQTWVDTDPIELRPSGVSTTYNTMSSCWDGATKLNAAYNGGTQYSLSCNDNATITSAMTRPSGYIYTAMTSADIGNCITTIGENAFKDCTSLSSVTIPTSVTKLGVRSFYKCESLPSITIPNSVTTIGQGAFAYCSTLTNLNIPNSVTNLGVAIAQNCISLTSVTIGNSVTNIGNYAFDGCSALTSITINVITPPTIGSNTFNNTNNCVIYVPCTQVNVYRTSSVWSTYASRIQGIPPCDEPTPTGDTKFKAYYSNGTSYTAACDSSLTITSVDTNPSGYQYSAMTNGEIGYCVTTISSNTFWNCTNISSITIANSVSTIEFNAFANCRNLINIDIPNSVTNIGDYAFSSCYSLTSVTLPSDIISIGSGAFNDCHSITNVIIPDSITTIAQWTFGNCWELSNVTIPKNLNSIGEFAFYDCHITNITLPSSLTRIGERAFASCRYLTELIIYATTPPTIVFSILEDTPIASNTGFIYVPSASVNRYKTASGWSKYASRIQAIP